jgi:hypothetical protein
MLRTWHTCPKDVILAGMAHMHTVTNQVPSLVNHNPALASRMDGQWGGALGTLRNGLDVAPILERALVKG